MKRLRDDLLLLFLMSWSASLLAQSAEDVPQRFETMVVTGTRLSDELYKLSNSTTVIGREDIEARNPASTLEMLRGVPGLQVTQFGGRGGIVSVFVRGGEPNFTLVMIDGIKVNDPNNTRGGSFDFSTLNVNDIERIEVVRGPQSAIYGSDALSGVINIITRSGGKEFEAAAEAEAGADDYVRGGVQLQGPVAGNGNYYLRAGYVDDGEPVQGSQFDMISYDGKLAFNPAEEFSVQLNGRYAHSNSESFPEESGGPDLAVVREVDNRGQDDYALGLTSQWDFAPAWTLNLQANYYSHDENTFSPGIAPGVRDGVPPNGQDAELDRTEAAVNAVYEFTRQVTATVGLDYRDEEGSAEGFVELGPGFQLPTDFDLDRDIMGYFVEMRFESDAGLTLQGSLRLDDPDGFSDETTGKLGLVYNFNNDATRLFANWGEGFKLPSFFALGSALVGNPDLRPEKSESWDVGIGHAFLEGDLWLNLSYYNNEFTDLIDFDAELFTSVNRSEVDTQGVEFEANYKASESLRLFGHLTYLDIDVDESGVQLRHRPDWRGGLSSQWQVRPDWLVDVAWLYVDETYDTSIPTGPLTLDSYNRVDATVTWTATDRLTLALAVDNLFDEDYEETIGFPAPDMRPRLSARYRF